VKKRHILIGSFILIFLSLLGITYAAFIDKGKILGSTFTVGSSDLKLLSNLSGGVDPSNLADELTGPTFNNIGSSWHQDYLLKLYNNGTSPAQIATHSNYATANDPDDLRSFIYVEPFPWNDANNNGVVDTGEEGTSLGRKTIIKWKTEGFDLGSLGTGEVKGLILRFSTDSVSDTKQGKSGVFDFEFDSIGL